MTERFLIGIDLGTTNCSLSFFDKKNTEAGTQTLAVPQWQDDGRVSLKTLPSFVYLASKSEIKKNRFALPFHSHSEAPVKFLLGIGAKDLSRENTGRTIHSAKSWLTVNQVDPESKFLPHNSDVILGNDRISAVEASSLLLSYLKECWEYEVGQKSGEKFADQQIVVTVPASFGINAQALTERAWKNSGFSAETTSLEEPLAAFYSYLACGDPETFEAGKIILVCDIGGGTSDFSLLETTGNIDQPVERIAVSPHLLLGGDNIDVAIATSIEKKLALGEDGKLSSASWANLVAAARHCKESLLADDSHEYHITIDKGGADLFSSTLSVTVLRSEVEEILNGFLPMVMPNEKPLEDDQSIREWGLPYAYDPAFTKHIAAFLNGRKIDAILFAGGTLESKYIRNKLEKVISSWQKDPIKVLGGALSKSLAISEGACLYLQAKDAGSGLIAAHFPYNVLLEVSSQTGTEKYLCVLAKNQAFGSEHVIEAPLHAVLNRTVGFRLYKENSSKLVVGNLYDDLADLAFISRLATRLELPGKESKKEHTVDLSLRAELSLTKSLRLSCISGDHEWPLIFALDGDQTLQDDSLVLDAKPKVKANIENETRKLISSYFGKKSVKENPSQLASELENMLEAERRNWHLAELRLVFDELFPHRTRRSRSVEHESSWLMLAGYSIRPGFGENRDSDRIEDLWQVYERGMFHPKDAKVLNQWFILWRRASGGLSPERQDRIFDKYSPLIRQKHANSPELLLLLGSLEKADSLKKIHFGNYLVKDILSGEKHLVEAKIWCLSRLASRVPLYASDAAVLRAKSVEPWIAAMMELSMKTKHYRRLDLFFKLAARKRDDRELDIDSGLTKKLIDHIKAQGLKEGEFESIVRYKPITAADQVMIFGEELPSGIFLKD